LDVRPLVPDDSEAAERLGRLAFGGSGPPSVTTEMAPGRSSWGAFENGQLVAKATDLHHEQWWDGAAVPAAGIAGVAVLPEHRGRGLARSLLRHLLGAARDRGAAVSNLYCTSAAVYRSLGYEVTGALRTMELPTLALSRARPDAPSGLRAGEPADLSAVQQLYEEVARAGNGMLTRRGSAFPPPPDGQLPIGVDGLTLVEQDGRLVGSATWRRGTGYGDDAVLRVPDLLAVHRDAASQLCAVLGSWATVTPTVRLRVLAWPDPVQSVLPMERLRVRQLDTWMHRPVDLLAAVGARGWSMGTKTAITFRLRDPLLEWNDRTWRLEAADGTFLLSPVDAPDGAVAELHVRGWSLLWCGSARARHLRASGWLSGGTASDDVVLDAMFGPGGPAGLLDYF
jgi:predicted acetyltransferase